MRSYVRGNGKAPLIIAHRGASRYAPENTRAAIGKALEVGVDMVEIDVHLTSDDQIVAIHDRTLQRTTTGNGPVRSYRMDELESLDAGSWFDPAFSTERIPRLSDILGQIGSSAELNIEIKSYPFHRIDPHHLAEMVVTCVERAQAADRVLFTSFDPTVLSAIRTRRPDAATGSLQSWVRNLLRDPLATANEIEASVFICSRQEFRGSSVEKAHERGMGVFVYTVNDVDEARRFIARGVDGIITDSPERMMEITK